MVAELFTQRTTQVSAKVLHFYVLNTLYNLECVTAQWRNMFMWELCSEPEFQFIALASRLLCRHSFSNYFSCKICLG